MATSSTCLAWLALEVVVLLVSAQAAQDDKCTMFQTFSSPRRARMYITLLFVAFLLLMAVMWLYSKSADRKYIRTSKKMERLKLTEDLLITILKNFSLSSVHNFHFRGIKPKQDKITVSFKELRTTIKAKGGVLNGFVQEPEKVLLAGVTGEFQPGRMAAIMGPSGAGKTTLLNVLCGKTKTGGGWQVDGSVFINGEEKSIAELRPVMGFVPQDDVVHEGMTVRENIWFSAELRNRKGTKRSALKKITEDVLKVLQLEAQQNIVVGNRATGAGGLSGGQRKRVNIGLELAACPTLLFLDEPTSGLDSTTSLMLCEMLKKMTDLGMTIVMVIHQPRYGLFTLIDDVLLLGKGGRTAYMGPTVEAKKYLHDLGFDMPHNENPADWMMDILSGQNVVGENPKMQIQTLPGALFDAWQQHRGAPMRRPEIVRRAHSRALLENDNQDVITRHVKDEWDKFTPEGGALEQETFTSFLENCVGFKMDGSDECEVMIRDLMEQAADNGAEEITQHQFVEHLLKFWRANRRGAEEEDDDDDDAPTSSDESDSGDSDEAFIEAGSLPRHEASPPRSDLHRALPGFCVHMKVVLQRNLLQWWRRMHIRMAFVGLVVFSAVFLGFFDAVIFKNPPWMPTVLLNAHVSVALLVSVYCLGCFSRDQPVYWREASHGLNRLAFMIARMIVDTIDVVLLCFFFTATYFVIVLPQLNFEIYAIPFFLVSQVASGWGYLISTSVPGVLAPFSTAVLCFMLGGILGLPDKMMIFLDGGLLEVIVDALCFTRWSAPMDFLAYEWCGDLNITDYHSPMIRTQYTIFKQGYSSAKFMLPVGQTSPWYTGVLALTMMALVLRLLTYPALRFVNASRQL